LDGERVRIGLRDLREAVVQVLRGRAHGHRGHVHEPLGDEARIEVDVLAHRMVSHVLDAPGEHDVACPVRDLTRAGGHSRERAGAHSVDRKTRNRLRDPRE